MTKNSRKTLRPKSKKPARKRTDNPVGCRVNDAELATIDADITAVGQASGITPTRGSYAKHAVLEYPRLRRIAVKLRTFYDHHKGILDGFAADITEGNEPNAPDGEFGAKPTIPAFEGFAKALDDVKAILEER